MESRDGFCTNLLGNGRQRPDRCRLLTLQRSASHCHQMIKRNAEVAIVVMQVLAGVRVEAASDNGSFDPTVHFGRGQVSLAEVANKPLWMSSLAPSCRNVSANAS